jgi:hypothetical protein
MMAARRRAHNLEDRQAAGPKPSACYLRPVRFDEKARENLDAAERLLPDETGLRDALSNAAASPR